MIAEKGDKSEKGTGKIEVGFAGDGKQVIHPEWALDIKISNDNTKGERRCTIHVRSDGDPKDAMEKALKAYKEGLGL